MANVGDKHVEANNQIRVIMIDVTEMKIFGLPLADSGLYCIATNILTPFCEPKIIPLVVDIQPLIPRVHTTSG